MPIAQSFAGHFEVVTHVRMKDEGQSHGAGGHDVVGEIGSSVTQVAILVGLQKARLRFRNRSNVGEFASFLSNRIASFIELLMHHVFDSGKLCYVVYELFHTLTGAFENLLEGAGSAESDWRLHLIDSRRSPGTLGQGRRRGGERQIRI